MSLLIKALQKAEQSKSAATTGAAEPPAAKPSIELELAPHEEPGGPSLNEEGGFEDIPRSGTRTPQQAASAVFRAKHGGGHGIPRGVWLGLAGLLLLVLLGGGFYLYLQSLEQPALVVTPPSVPAPPPQVQTPPAAESASPEVAQAPAPQSETVGESPAREAPEPKADAVRPAAAEVATPAATAAPKAKAQADEESAALKVTRGRAAAPAVNSSVMAGYQAYQAGDDAAASRYYRQAVQAEPRNLDALLGLAAVSARQGKTDEAAAQYMRVLGLEPRNATAQAGLASLTGQSDPVASESRLKTLLAQQPDAAYLHAALGNLYAEQSQWPSAQQAYFQAYRLDSANAEYAFNLAVSLDQLGKGDLALTYYQRALEQMTKQGASGLDKAQIEARIAQLQQFLNR